MKEQKTNAMRILEQKGVAFTPHHYESGPSHVSGEEVAKSLGLPPEQVFKTLLTRGVSGYYVFIIPSDAELHLKKAAAVCGEKKIEMLPVKELFDLTGYVRGGCSPIGMKKAFPTFLDETAILFRTIFVSAGKIGAQIELDPMDLQDAFGVEIVPLTMD